MTSSALELISPVLPETERKPDKKPTYLAVLYTLDISARFLLAGMFGKATVAYGDELLDGYGRRIFEAGNATLRVVGRERLDPAKSYVFMSNHRSLLDVPALFVAVPGSLRMVFKQELRKLPIWGRALVECGFVPVDRGNTKKAIEQLEEAKRTIRRGMNIWISPEGTRSRDGELLPFKKGGFHLARQLGVDIIPTWIEGTDDVIPPDSFVARYNGHARVTFGDPIATGDPNDRDVAPLMETVRQRILDLRS